MERGTDSGFRFTDRRVGETHDGEAGKAWPHIGLDSDDLNVGSVADGAERISQHVNSPRFRNFSQPTYSNFPVHEP